MSVRVVKDLVVLTADKNMEVAVRGLLSARTAALGIRKVSFDVYAHPERDPGCRLKAQEFLRGFAANYKHALVMFDRHGCGAEELTRVELEGAVAAQLEGAGWSGRAAALVLDPELEVWVWADSHHVPEILGWKGNLPHLRQALQEEEFWKLGVPKPHAPKEAVEHVLQTVKKPRSSALYLRLAESVSVAGCTDAAFAKFRAVMGGWFALNAS